MKKLIMLAAILMLTAGPAAAQKATKKAAPKGGLGLAYLMPKGDLGDSHDAGYGIHLLFDYELADKMEMTVTAGWNQLKARDDANQNGQYGTEDFTMWELTAGPRARVEWFYIGVEWGYFTKVDDLAWVPNAGIKYKIYDLGYRVKMGDSAEIHSIRAGIFF